MKKLLVIFLTVSFFASCKKDEVQVYEPTFDNYSRIFKIIEVSKDKIVLKNNTGESLYADQYIYSTKDTTVRVTNDLTLVSHQSTYTIAAAKPIDFRVDTVFLYKEDTITRNNTITMDTVLIDAFYPVGNIGF
jgi:hypothetical protein